MKRPEQEIHKAVVSHLNARAYPDVFFFHPPNGGKRGVVEGKIFKGLGVVAGVPDLIILRHGKMYGLELKAPKGRVSEIQSSCMAAMKWCGAQVAVAYSLDEALVTLECWGLIKRDSTPTVTTRSMLTAARS